MFDGRCGLKTVMWHDNLPSYEMDQLKHAKIAVVIPVYNEAPFIKNVLLGIPEWVEWIIVVDDASTDDSQKIIASITDHRIQYVAHRSNMGAGAALITGYKKALSLGSEVVAVMGGDGQMDPLDLSRVVIPVVKGWANYVKGNRFLYNKTTDKFNAGLKSENKIPFLRHIGIRLFTFITQLAAGRNDFGDSQCGFTAADKKLLETLNLDSMVQRYGFPNDMILSVTKAGFSLAEVPVRPVYRNEKSGIKPWRDLPSIFFHILKRKIDPSPISNKKERVVMLTTSFPRYETDHAGNFVAGLASELAKNLPVTVIAPDYPDAVWAPPGVSIRRFRWKGWDGKNSLAYGYGIIENLFAHPFSILLQMPGFLAAMCSVAAAEIRKNDMILTHWLIPSSWIAAKYSKNNQHLAIAHGSDITTLEFLPLIFRRMVLNKIWNHTNSIITVSNNLAQRLKKMSSSKAKMTITVMPISIDNKTFNGIRRKKEEKEKLTSLSSLKCQDEDRQILNILFMGRLIAVKGVDVLLKALEHIAEIQHKCLVHIAGDGPLLYGLEQTAKLSNLPVVFHGRVFGKAKEELFIISDIGVVPSIVTNRGSQEGMPMILWELMASKIPVIASRSGGMPDVLRSDFNGLLFTPGDSIDLAKALDHLLTNSDKRLYLANNALETVRKHNIKHFTACCLNSFKKNE